eukprot:GHVH01003805.1.p1 GENE.GHVH01003805.1~~GHVH01003805.1.p1  ORF type:complete len:574 (-),score=89.01 GHVH01003805.1:1493-3214(-)
MGDEEVKAAPVPHEDGGPTRDRTAELHPALVRTGGAYVPPFKLARLREESLRSAEGDYVQKQRIEWEELRKGLNGVVNKLSLDNIKPIMLETLQNFNLIRGRGLLVRCLMRAQLASPGFTHIFAAFAAVINSQLPDIGLLLLTRLVLQFRRAKRRNDRVNFKAVIDFIAHLCNQAVADCILLFQIAEIMLDEITDDSMEALVQVMLTGGKRLRETEPEGFLHIVDRIRNIMQEGRKQLSAQTFQVLEKFFAELRDGFPNYPGVLDELDLVEEDDQTSLMVDFMDASLQNQPELNVFNSKDPDEYEAEAEAWKKISREMLGVGSDDDEDNEDDASSGSDDSEEERIQNAAQNRDSAAAIDDVIDYTDEQLVELRKKVYLAIMSSANFEECVHKIQNLHIRDGAEIEVCRMLIDCCSMERTFQRFFALQCARLCALQEAYQQSFLDCFVNEYHSIHRLDSNKLRNTAKLFAHLLYTDAIPWTVLEVVKLQESTTTSAGRIFLKIIFQELAEHLGLEKLYKKLTDPEISPFIRGIFPMEDTRHIRFAINFFSAIGLGALTVQLRQRLTEFSGREYS